MFRIPLRIYARAFRAVFVQMNDSNLTLIAAGVAFYAMLAFFPAIAAIVAVWGFFADPAEVAAELSRAEALMPGEAFDIVDQQVTALASADASVLGWATVVSLGAALWSSRAGVLALIKGLNAIYRERNRNGIREQFAALGITFVLIGVALVALGSVVVLPIALAFVPLGPGAATIIEALRWAIASVVVVVALGLIYRYGPNRRAARSAWITPGALVAVVIWGGVSWAFSVYLSNFGNYNEIYGTLGAVIALLMWLWLSALCVLIGAAMNAELELRTRRDTTVGPDRPMGQREATVADRYVAR